MKKAGLFSVFFFLPALVSFSQNRQFELFLSDSVMANASVSFFVTDSDSAKMIMAHNPEASLIPASTMKLITSAAALELLGPEYTFKTSLGYTGKLNNRTGRLDGNIVISGGGDPSLGSEYFRDHYQDFFTNWIDEIKKAGITKIRGKVITDDSYYDYEPVAPRWLWEDLGAYFGAGVFGLSVFDNSCEIRVKSASDSSYVEIVGIKPDLHGYAFTNRLAASGRRGNWYVFAAPYSNSGWLSGTVPVRNEEYVLDGSIPDPPLLIAKIVHEMLESEGIDISEEPSTIRLQPETQASDITLITETHSPSLASIVDVLNRESVNLYAEHLVKELGKIYKNKGTTVAGIAVIREFLGNAGVDTAGLFIEDGSGLSSRNGINSKELAQFLVFMRNRGGYFSEFYSSLPEAGKNGTLAQYFTDPVFNSNLRAKSGSMTRVRCYAGYFKTNSGRNLAFSILVNNYQGPVSPVINHIAEILKEIILYK
jgi:D-alanyl-D-alanine carboxypeptidase/D-alanyl-D-alanine-endopeptidase (penicillin-binding protein 4)